MTADPVRRLGVLGPALRDVLTASGPVAAVMEHPDRALERSLFSSAARRALRRTGEAGATLQLAAAAPPRPVRSAPSAVHTDLFARETDRAPLDDALTRRPPVDAHHQRDREAARDRLRPARARPRHGHLPQRAAQERHRPPDREYRGADPAAARARRQRRDAAEPRAAARPRRRAQRPTRLGRPRGPRDEARAALPRNRSRRRTTSPPRAPRSRRRSTRRSTGRRSSTASSPASATPPGSSKASRPCPSSSHPSSTSRPGSSCATTPPSGCSQAPARSTPTASSGSRRTPRSSTRSCSGSTHSSSPSCASATTR